MRLFPHLAEAPQKLADVVVLGKAGGEDNRHDGVHLSDSPKALFPAHDWHGHIEHDRTYLGALVYERVQSLPSIGRHQGLETEALGHALASAAKQGLVVDKQQALVWGIRLTFRLGRGLGFAPSTLSKSR